MGYGDRDFVPQAVESRSDGLDTVRTLGALVLGFVVRTVGVLLILLGLWAATTVVKEAVALYRDPGRIERLVSSIEGVARLTPAVAHSVSGVPAASGAGQPAGPGPKSEAPRPAYLVAWLIVVLMSLLIGKLADWVIRGGAALALCGLRGRWDRA